MTYFEKIVDVSTGEETLREYTAEEIDAVKRAQAESAERIAKQEEAALAREALLKKLGITEDEAKLLLS